MLPHRQAKSYFIWALLFVPVLSVFLYSTSTFDNGDSIMHYLISRYSFHHPYLFFDHWGKPLFTILSSPFSHFGFTGMALFNALVIYLSAILVFETTFTLYQNYSISIVSAVSYLFCTKVLLFVHSGLTEPLFGLFLILSAHAVLHQRESLAAVLISFTPFIRSEGLIIMGIYLLFLVSRKHYKKIPLLFIGLVVFSILGKLFFSYDLLWFFTKNPYPVVEPNYGSSDDIFHYFNQFFYFSGLPFSILFSIGIIAFVYLIISKHTIISSQANTLFWTVLAPTGAYFFTHVVFWQIGCCGAFGIQRILMSIIPLSSVIISFGLITLHKTIDHKTILYTAQSIILVLVILFPFLHSPSSWNLSKDFQLDSTQKTALAMVEEKKDTIKNRKARILFSEPYLGLVLDVDIYDSTEADILDAENLNTKDLIIWDCWHSPVEREIPEYEFRVLFKKDNQVLENHFDLEEKSKLTYITNF